MPFVGQNFRKSNSSKFNHATLFFVWTMRFAWVEALNYFQNVILWKCDRCKKLICSGNKINWKLDAILHYATFVLTFLYLLLTSTFGLFQSFKNNVSRPVRILWNILKFWKVWALFWCLYSWYWTGIRWLLRLVLEVFLYLCNVFFSKLYVPHFPIVKIAGINDIDNKSFFLAWFNYFV